MLTRMNHENLVGFGAFRNPFALADELHREMDRIFESFERTFAVSDVRAISGSPLDLDVRDEGDRFVVRADVPGVTEQDIGVLYDNGVIGIRVRRDTTPPDGTSALRKERMSYEVRRTFALPCAIDAERAEATLRHGVLEIVLPKASEARPRQVPIRSET